MTDKTTLMSEHYFSLANSYLDTYNSCSDKLQEVDSGLSDEEKNELYYRSKPLIGQAYEFQKKGFKALTDELNVPAKSLTQAADAAAKAVHNIFLVGKVIEIVADLVAIGAILVVPALKPTSLLALPDLLGELKSDVQDLKLAE
jgi:hypothetical protein